MPYSKERLAANLRSKRAYLNLSRSDVSSRTGVSPATLQLLETGETTPKIDTILALAEFYDTTIDDLIDRQVRG